MNGLMVAFRKTKKLATPYQGYLLLEQFNFLIFEMRRFLHIVSFLTSDFKKPVFYNGFLKSDVRNETIWIQFSFSKRELVKIIIKQGDSFPLKVNPLTLWDGVSIWLKDLLSHIDWGSLIPVSGTFSSIVREVSTISTNFSMWNGHQQITKLIRMIAIIKITRFRASFLEFT